MRTGKELTPEQTVRWLGRWEWLRRWGITGLLSPLWMLALALCAVEIAACFPTMSPMRRTLTNAASGILGTGGFLLLAGVVLVAVAEAMRRVVLSRASACAAAVDLRQGEWIGYWKVASIEKESMRLVRSWLPSPARFVIHHSVYVIVCGVFVKLFTAPPGTGNAFYQPGSSALPVGFLIAVVIGMRFVSSRATIQIDSCGAVVSTPRVYWLARRAELSVDEWLDGVRTKHTMAFQCGSSRLMLAGFGPHELLDIHWPRLMNASVKIM